MASQGSELLTTDVKSAIDEAVHRLVEAAHPEQIILFGSYARGDFSDDSDLDLLVILPVVNDRFSETVRLSETVAPIRFPIDLMVYSRRDIEERGHLPGSALRWALEEGQVVYAAA